MAPIPTGTVTFLFTDIEDSTSMWSDRPQQMATAVEHHDGIVRAALEAGGGHVFATTGDGFAAAFSRCQHAVEAAMAIQAELDAVEWPPGCELRVRTGLHVGEAQERDGDYFGTAVNTAARVMSAAHGGQTVATASVMEVAIDTDVSWTELGEHRLRGVTRSVRIVQIDPPSSQRRFTPLRVQPELTGSAPGTDRGPLLERDHQLQELRAACEATGSRRGTMVFIGGEAGAGKTRLVQELRDSTEGSELMVLEGSCDPLSTPRPFGPLIDMEARPGSDLAGIVSTSSDPADVAMQVRDRLASSTHRHVLVFEDMHWTDTATVDLLRFLGRRMEGIPAVIACTFRPGELGDQHPFRLLLGELGSRREVRRIELAPLSRSAVAELISDGGSDLDAASVHEVTGGNAFFVTELLASDGAVPDTVRDAVVSRLGRLGDGSQDVARTVSIAPRAMRVDELSEVDAIATADVDAALHAGMLVLDDHGLRFRHELARAAVYSTIPPLRRQQLHLAIIDVLARRGTADAAELAHHAIASGDDRSVLERALPAATVAERSGSRRDAADLLRAAVSSAELVAPSRVAELRIRWGRMLRLAGDIGHAEEQLIAARQRARQHDDPAREGSALTALARFPPDPRERRQRLDAALAILRSIEPSP